MEQEIVTIPIAHLDGANHLAVMSEAADCLNTLDADALRLAPLCTELNNHIAREREAFKVVRKTAAAPQKRAWDTRRDNACAGFSETLHTAGRSFDEAVKAAVERLARLWHTYNTPRPMARLNYDAQTVAMTRFVDECTGPYAADIAAAGLGLWLTEMDTANKGFAQAVAAGDSESTGKPAFTLREARHDTDGTWKKITTVLNAHLITGGDAALTAAAANLNAILKRYDNMLAVHKGRGAAGEKPAETPATPEQTA